MKGNLTYYEPLQAQLTQLDKAANTEGWLILSTSGEVLVSSLIDERFSRSDRRAIVEQIHRQGEGVSLVNKTKGSSLCIIYRHRFLMASTSRVLSSYKLT